MAGRRARVRRLSSGSFHFAGIAALFGLLISSILYENCLADVSPDLGRALSSAVLTPTHLFFLFGKRGDYNSGPAYQKYFNDTLAIDLNRPKGGINSVSIFRDNSTNSNQTSSQLIPRASTSCAFDSESQRIYCVGGENNDTSLIPNPLFSLSVASGAFGGWTENPTTAPPRDASGSAVLGNVNINGSTSAGRQLVTFGGRYQAVNKTRDILTSELRALSLTSSFAPTLLSNTSTPPPRVFHCTVQLNSTTLFVGFGSSPDGKALDDTWIYTLDRNEWKSLDPLASGVKPPAMSGPACSLDSSRNRLVIFGPGTADRNQVSFLDLATLNWTIANIPVPDPALLEPSLRWGSSCAVVVDWLVCWGGYLVKSDLFTYDVRPYFLSLVPTPQWQYAPTTLLTPTPSSSGSGLSVGAIVGIAISLAVGIATIVSAGVFLYQRRKLRQKVERGEVDLEELRRDEAGWK